jgi:hypothetical protein
MPFHPFLVLSSFYVFTASGPLKAWKEREIEGGEICSSPSTANLPFQYDTIRFSVTCIFYRLKNYFLLCFLKQNKWICFHFMHYREDIRGPSYRSIVMGLTTPYCHINCLFCIRWLSNKLTRENRPALYVAILLLRSLVGWWRRYRTSRTCGNFLLDSEAMT